MTGPRMPLEDRIWPKVDRSGECWVWTGSKCGRGYGRIGLDDRPQLAHRVVYELLVGPIPDGLVIDHLCRNTSCVNPDHLEPVPQRTNVLRGESPFAKQARQTECKNGHLFDAANTIRWNGARKCRICTQANDRRRATEKRSLIKGGPNKEQQ